MEKDKKYNVVLGLMLFFFVIIVGVCLAFGLGIISINTNKTTSNNTPYVPDNKEIVQNNVPSVNNEEKTLTESEVEMLNKKYASTYLSALFGGSPEIRAVKIMQCSYEEIRTHYTGQVVDDIYKLTDIEYSDFTNKMSYLSKELKNNLYSFKSDIILFKEYNGKLAIFDSGWTGNGFEFVSQQLISSNDGEYIWRFIINRINVDETKEKVTYNINGRIQGEKYILTSVEEVK